MRLGVCYYPEHWPEAWWADDAQQMCALGISQVRIAEFCWSRVEPMQGVFDFGWLDRAVECLSTAGLQIVMCTPTATPPKWLVDADPEMLAVGSDGRRRSFGSRRHYDFSSDRYLEHAKRITREFGSRYGTHPSVIAWQIDNEFGCHDTSVSYSPQALHRFRLWLRRRYKNVDALNRAWGNVFWSQEYGTFDEIDLPRSTVTEPNPAHALDFRRFASDEVVRFNAVQCEILRKLSPGRVLTHNFMQGFTAFDHYDVASDLDVASWDSYPLGAVEMFWFDDAEKLRWQYTGHPDLAAFYHALYRGMSKQPFWVMEQQPGPVNWANWNPSPAPGMVRLWSWESFAHGADVVSYFRWRQAPFAQEQMHTGLLTSDRQLDHGAIEVRRVADELEKIKPGAIGRVSVALVFDYPSQWMLGIQAQGRDYNALQVVFEAYSALRSLGLDVDVLSTEADFSTYQLIVLPAVIAPTERFVSALLATNAQIVLYPRSGSKDEHFNISEGMPPGRLRSLIPIRVARVESLRPGATESVSYNGQTFVARRWRETVEADVDVAIVARFSTGNPAVLRRDRVTYLAGIFDDSMHRLLLRDIATRIGLVTQVLPEGVRTCLRGDCLFVFNYNEVAINVEWGSGERRLEWLVGGEAVPAYGVSIARSVEV